MNPQSNNLTMILGSQELTVIKRDGSQEKVQVRELKVSELPAYAAVIDKEDSIVELLCGKEPGWADTLTKDSFKAVIEKGDELNLSFFEEWARRRLERTRRIIPNFDQKMIETVRRGAQTRSEVSA